MIKKLILGAFLLLVGLAFLDKAYSAFNPFPSVSPSDGSITAKGNILSHNGSVQTQFVACADGKILEYDSTEDKGLLCGDKTSNASMLCAAGEYLNGDGTCDVAASMSQNTVGDGLIDMSASVNFIETSVALSNLDVKNAANGRTTYFVVSNTHGSNSIDVGFDESENGVTLVFDTEINDSGNSVISSYYNWYSLATVGDLTFITLLYRYGPPPPP